jgi:3-methyl-2-oxobutanoate hydroxymethyltransferase
MADAAPALTVPDLVEFKAEGRRITVLTCYDALFARLLDGRVDVLLVGDSLHQVLCGHETTLGATLDQMIYHGAAVVRGSRRSLVFVDLPFLTYQVSVTEAVRNAGRVLQETGADGVKLEGGVTMRETIGAMVRAGVPVMGHVGLTPQSVHQLGGYRVQGRGRTAGARLSQTPGGRGGGCLRGGARARAGGAGPADFPAIDHSDDRHRRGTRL